MFWSLHALLETGNFIGTLFSNWKTSRLLSVNCHWSHQVLTVPFHKFSRRSAHFQWVRWQMDKAGLLGGLCWRLPEEHGTPAIWDFSPSKGNHPLRVTVVNLAFNLLETKSRIHLMKNTRSYFDSSLEPLKSDFVIL